MPASPKIAHAGRFVGRVEVEGQLHIEHPGQTNGHVRVARKIKVELQGVGHCCEPSFGCGGQGTEVYRFEDGIGIGADAIGQHHLFEQAHRKNGQPCGHMGMVPTVDGRVGKLRHHLPVVQHGACDQVREIRDEKAIVHWVEFADLTLVGVCQKSDLGEAVKRDANRQHHMGHVPVAAHYRIQVVQEEVGVLEVRQHQEVQRDAHHQPHLGRQHLGVWALCIAFGDAQTHHEIHRDRAQQQECELWHPKAVEEQGSEK